MQLVPLAIVGKVCAVGCDGVGRKRPVKAREESIAGAARTHKNAQSSWAF